MVVKLVGGPLDGLQRSVQDGKPLPDVIPGHDHRSGRTVGYELVDGKANPPVYKYMEGKVPKLP